MLALKKNAMVSMSPLERKLANRNRAVLPQKMARSLKLQILKVEGLYYLRSDNKGADHLSSSCAADMHISICICK